MQQAEQQPYIRMGTVRVPYGTHETKAKATGEGYTPFSNLFLQNPRMSNAAKGLLVSRLSYQAEKDSTLKDIVAVKFEIPLDERDNYNIDGKHSIRSQIEELIDLGHCCKVIERRTDTGYIAQAHYIFFESPQDLKYKVVMINTINGIEYASEPKTHRKPRVIKIHEEDVDIVDIAERHGVPVETLQGIYDEIANLGEKSKTHKPIIKIEDHAPKNSSVVERPLEEEETEIFEQSPIIKEAQTTEKTKVLSFKERLKENTLLKSKLLLEKQNVTEEDYNILIGQFTEWDGSKAHKAYKDYEHHFTMWIRKKNIEKWRKDYKAALVAERIKATHSVLSDEAQEALRNELKRKSEAIKINGLTRFEHFDRALTDFLQTFKKCLDARVLKDETILACRKFSDYGATRTLRRAYFDDIQRGFDPNTGEKKEINNYDIDAA